MFSNTNTDSYLQAECVYLRRSIVSQFLVSREDRRGGLAHRVQAATVLADPPWRFVNRTGKMAPEHRRLSRYGTLTVEEIASLPVQKIPAGSGLEVAACRM
jgi:hypothetical protein